MKIVFMGTPHAAATSLERLVSDGHEVVAVYTQPDRPSGRGNKIIYSPVKQLAIANGLAVHQPSQIKTSDAFDVFRSHQAEAAVVVAYGRILPEAFLNAFEKGAINLHFSLLPKYRGAAPVNRAIVNGESSTGVSTIQMDAGMDTGALLMQLSTHIGARETSVELMERLSFLGAGLLSETLASYDNIEPVPQDNHLASPAPIMKRSDGLIDWQMSAEEISNRVRGFQPFPTTFTFLNGAKMTLWQASTEEDLDESRAKQGEILSLENGIIKVKCGGDSILIIEEVQPENKKRMSAKDYLNGSDVNIGTVFGSQLT